MGGAPFRVSMARRHAWCLATVLVAVFLCADGAPHPDVVVPEQALQQTSRHELTGEPDDSEDVGDSLHDTNSVGMNKLTGTPDYQPDTADGEHVRAPGYTDKDAETSEGGHYYIGPSRRRIGAGFGRRRAPAYQSEDTKKGAEATLDKLGADPPPPTPPPTAPPGSLPDDDDADEAEESPDDEGGPDADVDHMLHPEETPIGMPGPDPKP